MRLEISLGRTREPPAGRQYRRMALSAPTGYAYFLAADGAAAAKEVKRHGASVKLLQVAVERGGWDWAENVPASAGGLKGD